VRLARSLADSENDGRIDRSCDVSDPEAVTRVVGGIVADEGTPDILVNNAGAFTVAPLGDTTAADFQGQLATNLVAPFLVLREILPGMLARGSGHVVTVGSIADHLALSGNAGYAASKFGVRGLHEVLREETRGTGVRSTLVSPAATDTDLWNDLDPDNNDILPSRDSMLRPGDVADAVLFALSRPAGVNVDLVRVSPA
jgi:NADP-dependent 3-hydroxy acid dehydrogenase YdfG